MTERQVAMDVPGRWWWWKEIKDIIFLVLTVTDSNFVKYRLNRSRQIEV